MMRRKSENAKLRRTNCVVSYSDPEGLEHSVVVMADSLFEAAAMALRAQRLWPNPTRPELPPKSSRVDSLTWP
jgi:hypothetical protein